jgi:serine/threonine protein kinase/ABC-type branched-subunit amino acid transport system substrate-binding protein
MTYYSGAVPSDPFSIVGTLVERKYRVDRVVAEGGFGIVYAGHHIALDAPIALKVMRPSGVDADAWADVLAQFVQEAKTIARLKHPAVVSVMDVGVMYPAAFPAGVPWMVMEWLEGTTLLDDLAPRRAKGGRSVAEAFALLRPVIEAIAEAHEAGIVHRDLKPSNIMLVPRKRGGVRARVLDFGIAKAMDADRAAPSGHTTTQANVKAFSAAAAAPEQISGTRTGPWTDVHALGLLLSELLTDASPYPLADPTDHFRAVFDERRPTPAKAGVDVGPWEAVIARALALKPADRFADAGELLRALEDALPAEARSGQVAERTAPSGAPPPVRRSGAPTPREDAVPSQTEQSVSLDRRPSDAPAPLQSTPPPRTPGRLALIAVAGVALASATWWAVRRDPAAQPRVDAAPPPKCANNGECTSRNGGRASVCRGEVGCVEIASADCQALADTRAAASDRTLWIGAMFPVTGEDAKAFGQSNMNALDLARRDFEQITAGLTESERDRARPFGVVACNDAEDPKRAAAHLVNDVGVPAVVGFRASVEAIELATSLFIPKRVVTVAALNTNPLVTTVPQPAGEPRLVWRTTYNNASSAGALGALVADVLEPRLRAAGGALGAEGTMKVALLRPKNAAGAAFSDALFRALTFNKRSALDNGEAFRELTFDAAADDKSPAFADVVSDLVRMKPHAIVFSGTPLVMARAVFEPLEKRWPAAERHRPTYASLALLTPELLEFIGTSTDRRRRLFGVTTVSTTPPNARFVMHYNEVFSDKITRTISPNSTYDAFYLLAYASYALDPDERPTGPALARAFARLVPPGRPIDVGQSGIFDAFAALRGGQNVDLNGATGAMDFDLATGEAPFDQAIVCAAVDEQGKAYDGVESGMVWAAKTRRLEGTMKCP